MSANLEDPAVAPGLEKINPCYVALSIIMIISAGDTAVPILSNFLILQVSRLSGLLKLIHKALAEVTDSFC